MKKLEKLSGGWMTQELFLGGSTSAFVKLEVFLSVRNYRPP